ncbi:MFS transporter (plasmid) [Rhizobium bangladeshense]|uniref:MFS transporter n=1 Tax=Rhizobium bangladeshense TaxID=1138189 RepID=UPI001A996B4A|nr:MFS transporter [Rhizobium bangladeshense]QSY97938.1 MFS transporter [Rhizobium bangladeshense]
MSIQNPTISERLDRLSINAFHKRLFAVVAIGMFFEGFDIYLAASVLGDTFKSGFSTLAQNGLFISATFVGMTLGALGSGFIGDKIGRKKIYQWNLLLFGGAAVASIFAPNMTWLIFLRFLMGVGIGAETVVGYSLITEFFPAPVRGRWLGYIATAVSAGLPASALCAYLFLPTFGWKVMFVFGGFGALIAWLLRRELPESPRWLASIGRSAEADALLSKIESYGTSSPAVSSVKAADDVLLEAGTFTRNAIAGSVALMAVNTLIYGFIVWLPTFMVGQGETIAKSSAFALVMSIGGLIGSFAGGWLADLAGRRATIITAGLLVIVLASAFSGTNDPFYMPLLGFFLTLPIYVLVAVLFAIYVPELFNTTTRLRGVGLCNAAGRAVSIFVPLAIGPTFAAYGLSGVLVIMSVAIFAMIGAVGLIGKGAARYASSPVTR